MHITAVGSAEMCGKLGLVTTFDGVLDWLTAREGKTVYLEVGVRDQTVTDRVYSFFPVAMHVVIGKWALGEDDLDGRGIVCLPIQGLERSRLFLDPARVTDLIDRVPWIHLRQHGWRSSIAADMSTDSTPTPDPVIPWWGFDHKFA